ncbi:MAG: methyltransferase domain-containing protein [Thermoplasmatales archaeon]|nr:MAG: methyltransferase domain-containing protein [Thermoplasmatales archaeon]
MNLLFELSKEHNALPRDEAISCLKAEEVFYNKVASNEDVLVIKSDAAHDKIKRIAERLSFTFFIDELLFSCSTSLKEINKCAEDNAIYSKGSIAINYKNRSTYTDSQPIVKTLAEVYTKDKPVDFNNPDLEMRVLITDTNVYVGLKIAEVQRNKFEKRKVQYRPFFSPISLHPKLARALVNLSCIKRNETLLDPFCGTGGILLEAGLIGARVIGSDIEEKMIEGSKKTLDFYNLKNYKLICSDIGKINNYVNSVDAVVTDLPYGKSTTTKGENIKSLHTRAFQNISQVLKKNGLAIIGLLGKDMLTIGEKYFSLLNNYEHKVHRSLTRYFAVFQR